MSNALELKVLFTAVDKFVRPVKAITGAAKEASQALKASTDRISELNGTVNKIDAFKKVEREAAIVANTLKSTERQMAELRAEISKVGAPTKEMSSELEKLAEKSERLKETTRKLNASEVDLRTSLKLSGVDTKNLASAREHLVAASSAELTMSRKLQAALDAENQKMKRLHAAQKDLAKTKEAAGKMAGTGGKMMAGGAAASAAAAVPVAAYATAEEAATQLKVAMMRKGGQVTDQFKEINDLANALGNKLPGTTADFQNMMTMLVRQGMSAESILGGLGKATAFLSVQLKMTPTAAAEFASKLQDATRTTDKDMMGLMDTIQKTFYLGVDQNNMLEAFKGLGAVMDMTKVKGLEGANALAPFVVMMDQMGMKGESAGNAIRKVVGKSLDVDKIKKVTDDLKKEKGISLKLDFTDGKGEFGGIEQMMAQLAKLKDLNTVNRNAILKDLYGDDKETNEVLSKIIEKGMDGYKEVQAKMEAQASLQERVNAQLGTLNNLWDAASGTFTNALVAFGESIAPELHATAEWLGKVAEKTQAWAKDHPQLSGAIMTTAKWTGLLLVALGAAALGIASIIVPISFVKNQFDKLAISTEGGTARMSLFSRISEKITPAASGLATRVLPMLSGAFASLGAIIAATPLGWLIGIVAGLAVIGLIVYKNWEPIKAFFSGFWKGLSKAAGPALEKLWENFKILLGKVGEFLNLIPGFNTIVVPAFKLAAAACGEIWDWIDKLFSPTKKSTDAAGELGEKWGAVAGEIIAKFVSLPSDMMQIGANMIDGIIDGITSRWEPLRAKLHELALSLPEWMRKPLDIHSPSRVFAEIGGHTMAGLEEGLTGGEGGPLDAVSGMAKKLAGIGAGMAIGGAAMAGGVTLDSRSPASAGGADAAGGSGGGDTYHITIQAPPGSDVKTLEAMVERVLERAESRKAARQRSQLRDTA